MIRSLCSLCAWPCSSDESNMDSYEWAVFPDDLYYLMSDYCVQCIINIECARDLESWITLSPFEFMRIASIVMDSVQDSEQRYKGVFTDKSELWTIFTNASCISELAVADLKKLVNDKLLVRKYIFGRKASLVLESGGCSFENSSFQKYENFAAWEN